MIKLALIICIFAFQTGYGNIHVLYTSALIPESYDTRQKEYVKSLKKWRSYGIDPWIIEATNINNSFFDKLSDRVLYPQVHHDSYANKGCNELLSMRASIPHLPFSDDDIVIKVTGRYLLYQPEFLNVIKQNPGYDVYVKYWPESARTSWYHDIRKFVFTGCFAMRWKIFKEMLVLLDEIELEKNITWIESAIAQFLEEKNLKVLYVEKIFMLAKIWGLEQVVWRL